MAAPAEGVRRVEGPASIAVLDDYQGIAQRYGALADLGSEVTVTVFEDHVADPDRLVERLAGFEVVMAMRERTPFPRDVLARLPQLRLLTTTGMGNAAIDMDAAKDLGIVVSGTGGGPAGIQPTTELTWGLILALARRIPAEDGSVRAGGWQHTVGTDLAGTTLGVIGLGNLGSQVARIGQAFGMSVVAWSQNLQPEAAARLGVTAVSKESLFRESDVVSIHLKLSDRTRGLVGRDELALMKPTALVINTSRGPIVDEHALVAALASGAIGGAGLDTFDVEPLPADHPLRGAPNTVLTPHIGYGTDQTYRAFYAQTVDNIAAYLRGEPVRVLNPLGGRST